MKPRAVAVCRRCGGSSSVRPQPEVDDMDDHPRKPETRRCLRLREVERNSDINSIGGEEVYVVIVALICENGSAAVATPSTISNRG
jgi:hypothetical protein